MTREEQWLGAIAGMDGVSAPDMPVWHYEEMLAAIYDAVTGASPARPFPARSWHLDEVLYAVYCAAAGLDDPGCPEPTCRIEMFWKGIYDAASGSGSTGVPAPVWRLEEFLSAVFTASAGWGGQILTGSIVSFIGRASTEILACTAAVTPVQSGSGDPSPSNVRPITGRTGANIVRTGKNLLKNRLSGSGEKNSLTYVVNADGSITVNGTADGTSTLPDILHPADTEKVPAGSYILSGCPEGGASNTYRLVLKKGTTYYTDTGSGAAFTINRGENYEIYIRYNSGTVFNNLTFKPMIRLATETDDTYEPYAGETYAADWTDAAGTVYAGSYEAASGKLKARPQYSAYNGETLVGPWLSSMDVYEEGATPTTGAQVVDLGGTETEYALTPQTVTALVGKNHIWADTGEVTVKVKRAATP